MKVQRFGIKWPNIITGRDYSEGSFFAEIHLKIYLKDETVAAELNQAIGTAVGSGQPTLRSAKAILRAELERVGYDNEGNLALVSALRLPPENPGGGASTGLTRKASRGGSQQKRKP